MARRIVSIRRTPHWPYLIGLAVLGASPRACAGADRRCQRPARRGRREDLQHTPPSAELKHIRVVPEESAIFAGNKVVGQLGAYYRVGNLQRAGRERPAGVGRAARFSGPDPMAGAAHESRRDRRERGESRCSPRNCAPARAAALHSVGAAERKRRAPRLHDLWDGGRSSK